METQGFYDALLTDEDDRGWTRGKSAGSKAKTHRGTLTEIMRMNITIVAGGTADERR